MTEESIILLASALKWIGTAILTSGILRAIFND